MIIMVDASSDEPGPRPVTGAAPAVATQAWRRHLPPSVDVDGLDLLAGGSLPRVLATRWANAPAVNVLHSAEHGWRTAADMERATSRVAAGLAARGLRRGDRLALCMETSSLFVDVYLGALRLGVVVVLLNPSCSEAEARHIARDADPAGAVVSDAQRGAWIADAAPSLRAGLVAAASLAEDGAAAPAGLDGVGPSDPALLMYTSGTTGTPKGALLSHGNLLASATALRLAWRWTEQDRLVLALPLFHAHGLGVGLNGTLLSGASAVLLPRFDAAAVLDAASQHRATLFFGVPTMYTRLAAEPRAAELSRLRLCVSGSAPLAAAMHARIEELSGQRILERYGMTETLMNVSNPHDGERRPGTVGLPLPGVELRMADGAAGEIQVRGPNVFGGYWRNPQATAAVLDEDGWFHTGDVGELDEAGYLRIAGRTRELIITGGYNVYPREVEDALSVHPWVAEAAVVGAPSEEWGEVVTAFVVAADPRLDAGTLTRHARAKLAPYKVPRDVRFVAALPRNAMDKVVKQQLVVGEESR
ncbi:MAG TPA: AMP-binding protein [Candidatus Dormibacteraeota bacterium]|jgi:malonyl-CoA/methylmalonyl-CoA synthetase|nr:AMP-binding protein [Candidatus Dormibacteraeota bacterium]